MLNKELKKKVKEAKVIAKKDYDDYLDRINAGNPEFKRAWREQKLTDGNIAFALEGTPDKAFVLVDVKTGKVKAMRQDKSIIKEL